MFPFLFRLILWAVIIYTMLINLAKSVTQSTRLMTVSSALLSILLVMVSWSIRPEFAMVTLLFLLTQTKILESIMKMEE